MLPRIAYVTHAGSAGRDPDLPLALAAFKRAGLEGLPRAWDADVDWADFDLVVVRSVWDYHDRRQEFLRWARSVERETLLANPALMLARNSDKTYLRDLAGRGVSVVDTVWFEPGDVAANCRDTLEAHGWSRFHIKPNIGGSLADTRLAQSAAEATALAEGLVTNGRVAMIQPHFADSEQTARVSVVVLGGLISHAVTRTPPLASGGDWRAGDLVEITADIVDAVERVMRVAADGEDLLYARVDLVAHAGTWLLMEFEATEPCLFLDADPQAASRLAHAVRQALTPDARQWDSASG